MSDIGFGGKDRDHHVVVNHEDQYSIWPTDMTIPAGWKLVGFTGKTEECLAYIDETWTDMRPSSVRAAMSNEAG